MIMAPVERGPEHLMSRICGSSTKLQQIEARTQPHQRILYAEDRSSPGRELDCQCYAVELAANLRHNRCFIVAKRKILAARADTLHEQTCGRIGKRLGCRQPRLLRRAVQGMKAEYGFARSLQGFTAGRKYANVGGASKDSVGKLRCPLDDMLATIENNESLPSAQEFQQ